MPLKYLICELDITTVQNSYSGKFGDFDIPHTGTYNLDGISPGKKLCLLEFCRERTASMYQITVFSFGRRVFYLRKTDGGLTTRTAANQRRPTFVA